MRMIRRLLCLALLLFGLWTRALAGPAQEARQSVPHASGAAYDAPSFVAELHRVADILKQKPSTKDLVALSNTLPSHWTVSTPQFTYSLSSEPLRRQLTSLSANNALTWVNHLTAEVEATYAPAAATSPQARAELDRILARPEFAAVRPPSAWELLRRRIVAWLEEQLVRLFQGLDRHPLGGRILLWLILLGAVGFIALGLFRFLSSRDRASVLPRSAVVLAARTWQEWVHAAHDAAKRGDYREAVHSAYWAGVARLEDAGLLPQDRTKTPREYLRLVDTPAPGPLAPAKTHREPLAALTSRLEKVWYANRDAHPEDYQDSLRQLEALGCTLE
jgi:hypothetical protein